MYRHLVDVEKNTHKASGINVISLVFKKNDNVSQDMIDAYFSFYVELLENNSKFIILYDLTKIGYNKSMLKLLDNNDKFRKLDDIVKEKIVCSIVIINNIFLQKIVEMIPTVVHTQTFKNKDDGFNYIKKILKK